ncbi:MAG: T9SS type A sorting domain-containing protein [Bacteroidales bacterium]|nr:T9SS type A sorting domain-containing protein [Bacteroidales bacterium]
MKKHIHFVNSLRTRKLILIMALVFWGTTLASAGIYNYSDNWGKAGYSIVSQSNSHIEINYSIDKFFLIDMEIDGETYQHLELPGNFLPNNPGTPDIPGSGRYVAIPRGSDVSFSIVSCRSDTVHNVSIAPAFRIPENETDNLLEYPFNKSIYSSDTFYPEQPVILSEKDKIRGIDVIKLGITPFQYNPVLKQLIIYRDIKIDITFEGGDGHFGEDRLRSRWWDPMLSDILLNYESLPKMDYNKSFDPSEETGCEYLVISPNGTPFQNWAESVRSFRTTQGILTQVVTLSEIGGNTTTLIENYINNAYNTWDIPPAAILLLGDYGTSASDRVISPAWNNYCVSDNVYGDVNGNDLPDIIMARMTARDETELEVMVTKFLQNEIDPPTDPEFYNHPITSLGWNTASWYQLCSEVIGGFWREELGKDPVRINEVSNGTPGNVWSTAPNTAAVVSYFGSAGLGYIPDDPSVLGGWTGGNAEAMSTAIDSGAFMIQHRNGGFIEGWTTPSYTITDINSLLNTELTFIWSIDALTGKFNYSNEVFAEKFHRYTHKDENSGCFGIVAASEINYNFVSDVYTWAAYDYMWPEFMPDFGTNPEPRGIMPAFANAAAKYFLDQENWPYTVENKIPTYHLFHHHGDAFSSVYSETPQNLSVSHSNIIYMGETSFEITANDGSLIGLSVNGELIASAAGTGNPEVITIPPQAPPAQVLVTVTKQNHFRYTSIVDVLPATGAFVVFDTITLNDASGNNNGIMETGEVIMATVTVDNVGIEDAANVVVKLVSSDPYVSITDSTEVYGEILAGNSKQITDGFAWQVSDVIPDLHEVHFNLIATDGSSTWNSEVTVTAHAPDIDFGTWFIDELSGNGNGRFDPGETVYVIIPTINSGSYVAENTMGYLSCNSEYITINNASFNFFSINPGVTEEGVYNVTVSDNAPVGEYVEFLYEIETGSYTYQHVYSSLISPVVEDWESGDLTQFEWETGGDNVWDITILDPFEGSYSVQSGTLQDEDSTYLSLDYEVYFADTVSFWLKVSSESGYDELGFYVDDTEMGSWSGEINWTRESFFVSAGNHTFTWLYKKDETISSGLDAAWLDFIVFPGHVLQANFSADQTEICEGDEITFTDESPGDITAWDWTFEGGTPSTSNLQNPVITYATPGVFDVSLTVYSGTSSATSTMEDYLTVSAVPGQSPTPFGDETVCATASSTDYATSGITGITNYTWLLEPASAGTVNGGGLFATVIWDTGFEGEATLKVAAENECGDGPFSDELMISRYLPEVTLTPFETVCLTWPAFELSGGMPEGGVYEGPGVEDGFFDPQVAGLGTHTISYTYTDPEGCENFAEETIYVDPCPGIDQKTEKSFQIFPNPGDGNFTIVLPELRDDLEIEVYNALNKQVYQQTILQAQANAKTQVNLNHLKEGIYYLHIKGGDLDYVEKLLIRK